MIIRDSLDFQPTLTILFFEGGQHGRERIIGELLAMLEIGRLPSRECPIVHEAAASERLRKNRLLFIGWIEPILVHSLRFAHYLFAFHEDR